MTTGNALHIVAIFIWNLCAFLVIPCIATHIVISHKNAFCNTLVTWSALNYIIKDYTNICKNYWEGRVQLKCDVTRWRTGGEVKGKLANGVGSQYSSHDGFGGLVVSMLASGSRVRGFEPDRSRWILSDVKKSSACLPSEGK
jgi:hypothetical protein